MKTKKETKMSDEKHPINTHRRLFDLVRYMRSELHEAELIDEDEYAWLCSEAELAKGSGSPSPRRLEDYDVLKDRMKRMEAALKPLAACAERAEKQDLETQKLLGTGPMSNGATVGWGVTYGMLKAAKAAIV